MPTIPVNFALVAHRFTGLAAPDGSEITFGVDITGYVGDPDDLATSLHTQWETQCLPDQASTLTLESTYVKFGPNATGPVGERFDAAAGGGGATAVSPQVALLVRKRTAVGGARGHGNLYVPGLGDGEVDASGVVSPASIAVWQSNMDSWLAGVNGLAGVEMVLLHSPSEISATPAPNVITGLAVQQKVATQRRRVR